MVFRAMDWSNLLRDLYSACTQLMTHRCTGSVAISAFVNDVNLPRTKWRRRAPVCLDRQHGARQARDCAQAHYMLHHVQPFFHVVAVISRTLICRLHQPSETAAVHRPFSSSTYIREGRLVGRVTCRLQWSFSPRGCSAGRHWRRYNPARRGEATESIRPSVRARRRRQTQSTV